MTHLFLFYRSSWENVPALYGSWEKAESVAVRVGGMCCVLKVVAGSRSPRGGGHMYGDVVCSVSINSLVEHAGGSPVQRSPLHLLYEGSDADVSLVLTSHTSGYPCQGEVSRWGHLLDQCQGRVGVWRAVTAVLQWCKSTSVVGSSFSQITHVILSHWNPSAKDLPICTFAWGSSEVLENPWCR